MSGKRNILLVEDEENLASVIKLNLQLEHYEATHIVNGKDAVTNFQQKDYDLVILDIMLPEMNGFEVCKTLKKIKQDVPVLFISAKSSSIDKIEGLKLGADDYLVKPFDLEELLLRIRILLKRYPQKNINELFTFNGGEINFSTFEVKDFNGIIHNLSNREIQLLKILTDKKNQVVSRDEILEQLWSTTENPSSRTIDNYILNFRKIFEPDSSENKYFHSLRGIGYKFTKN
jgi:two-component system alkaline phosphatase synthesis response regulator PhoP